MSGLTSWQIVASNRCAADFPRVTAATTGVRYIRRFCVTLAVTER